MMIVQRRLYTNHLWSVAFASLVLALNLFIGATPFVDNAGNTGGFVLGFMAGLCPVLVRQQVCVHVCVCVCVGGGGGAAEGPQGVAAASLGGSQRHVGRGRARAVSCCLLHGGAPGRAAPLLMLLHRRRAARPKLTPPPSTALLLTQLLLLQLCV
jgi:hypothetical protein